MDVLRYPQSGMYRRLVPRLIAVLAALNGLVSLLYPALVRVAQEPAVLGLALPFGVHAWGRSLTIAFGFALLFLSFHLWRRRRVAWGATLVASIAACVAHALKGDAVILALSPAGLGLLLIVYRTAFTVRSEPPPLRLGLATAVLMATTALAYGTVGFWFLDPRDFGTNFHALDALHRTARELTLLGNPDLVARTRAAHWFLRSLDVAGATAALLAALSLVRPLRYRLTTLPREREEVRILLETYGGRAIDHFKLSGDKSYFFNHDRTAAVAYGGAHGTAIGLGDPVGATEARLEVLADFTGWAATNGWTPAFHQVSSELLPAYRRLGYDILKVGEEASVDLDRFVSVTSGRKPLRNVRRKFEGSGFTFERAEPPIPELILDEAQAVSQEWLRIPGRRERRFTLGQFDRGELRATPVLLVRSPDGQCVAFANLIPSYRAGETTVDLMRHRLTIENGTMDFLFVRTMLDLHERGYRWFSLGLAPFAGVGDTPGATLVERGLHEVTEHLTRVFSYKGLRAYKAKFEPEWEPRFLAYHGGPVGLGRVTLGLATLTEDR